MISKIIEINKKYLCFGKFRIKYGLETIVNKHQAPCKRVETEETQNPIKTRYSTIL